MNDIINLITQNGIGVICVGYFIYFQSKIWPDMMTKFINTLEKMNIRLTHIEDKLDIPESEDTNNVL